MGRPPRQLPETAPERPLPSGDAVLEALHRALQPLIRLLLNAGVDYTQLTAALKPLFVEQARVELLRTGRKDTDSAISLLSGVHRKDLRDWRRNGAQERNASGLSMSAQVFARWVQDPLYRDRRKHPRALPRLGPAPSFDALARTVTQDVHPYTVLTELVRLGLVRMERRKGEEFVVPHPEGFVPPPGSQEMLQLFGANLGDHAATAVSNVLGASPQLEQSVFAEGLSEESVERLSELARKLWAQARSEMIAEATRLYQAGEGKTTATRRMRFGAYYLATDMRNDSEATGPSGGEDDETR